MSDGQKCVLSVCLIVRDEEKHIRECLASIRSVADEIIVVDTGSRDRTLDIVQEFDVRVSHFTWCDDFSAARNASIANAAGDWILWIDADERLSADSIPELKNLLVEEPAPVIYGVQIRSAISDNGGDHLSTAHRLFTNHRGISFSGRIHEQVSPSVAAMGGIERQSSIMIDHVGYHREAVDQGVKAKRNLKLLHRMVKENPDFAYAHYKLAQQYSVIGKFRKSLPYFRKAVRLNQFNVDMTASLYNAFSESLMAEGRLKEARAYCSKSEKLCSTQVGTYLLRYRIALKEGDEERIKQCLDELNAQNRKMAGAEKAISTDVRIPQDKIENEYVAIYLRQEKPREALKHLLDAYSSHPDSILLLEKIVKMYVTHNDSQAVETYLTELYRLMPNHELILEYYGTVLIRNQNFEAAIKYYEACLAQEANDSLVIRRLGGLYAKVGRVDLAKELLGKLENTASLAAG